MTSPLDHITDHRIIPVVVIDDAATAATLGDALVDGGLPLAEITFRTSAAPDTISTLADRGISLWGRARLRPCPMLMLPSKQAHRFWCHRG